MKAFMLTLLFTTVVSAPLAAGERTVVDLVAKDSVRASNVALQLAPLKSASDVYQYMQATPRNLSPLSVLSDSARNNFVQSLRFNEKGLTQFDYTTLENLAPTEIYKILSLFGMQSSAGAIGARPVTKLDKDILTPSLRADDFLMDYRCSDRATCSSSVRTACTKNC